MTDTRKTDKKTYAEKLGLLIKPSKIDYYLNNINSEEEKHFNIVVQELEKIKKVGAVPPKKFELLSPVKPKDGGSLVQYTLNKEAYKLEYEKHLEEQRIYDNYSSDAYNTGMCVYQIYVVLNNLKTLLAEKETPNKKLEIEALFTKLRESGLKRPVFREEQRTIERDGKIETKTVKVLSGKEIVKKYTDVFPELANISDVEKLLGTIMVHHKEILGLFEQKQRIKQSQFKFNKSVTFSVGYMLQKSLESILNLALDDTKKQNLCTVKINSLRTDVISRSPFYVFFHGLRSTLAHNSYMERLRFHEEGKLYVTEQKKLKNSKLAHVSVDTFEESERKSGNMRADTKTKKKYWENLNCEPNSVNFMNYIGIVFDKVKQDRSAFKKYKLNYRVKEYLSNLSAQFLQTMSERFAFHRNLRSITGTNDVKQKSITFDGVINIFGIILVPERCEEVKRVFGEVCVFRQKLKELKTKPVTN